MSTTKLVVDAMGGDDAPSVVLEGTAAAVEHNPELEVILTGPADVIEPFADEHDRVTAHSTTEVIAMDEHPAEAVRNKKDSSIVVGCRLVKEGEADGFFSAGSTGACLAAATIVMGRLKGVKRPGLVSVIPSPQAQTVICDLGANADCKPEYLVQFATMGSVYAQVVLGVENPRIGLLSIGEEDTKGSEFVLECNKLMHEQVPGFIGNAEGRDISLGGFDVIVTDGFTGNVALKTYEGLGSALLSGLRKALTANTRSKIGASLCMSGINDLRAQLDPDAHGGAQLLGVQGVCMVGHGNSNAKAIENGLLISANAVEQKMTERLADLLEEAE